MGGNRRQTIMWCFHSSGARSCPSLGLLLASTASCRPSSCAPADGMLYTALSGATAAGVEWRVSNGLARPAVIHSERRPAQQKPSLTVAAAWCALLLPRLVSKLRRRLAGNWPTDYQRIAARACPTASHNSGAAQCNTSQLHCTVGAQFH